MIEVQELSRRYGDFTAVDRVSFAVDEGEIVGILGPNGAGKTTTIRMITGFLPPTGGRVTVAGKDLFREPRRARRDIGYLPENVALYPEMRVEEYLAYRARLEGLGRGAARGAIGEAVERALLEDVRGQIIGTLSKGYRQRVALAAAILHRPRVLVLDEPTVGLDPRQIIAIRSLIRELGSRRTLLLSTHILPEVELLCDRVLIIDRGRIVAHGTPAELIARSRGQRRLRVELKHAGPDAAVVLGSLPGVGSVAVTGAGASGDGSAAARRCGEGGATDGGAHGGRRRCGRRGGRGGRTFRLDVDEGADPREAVFRTAVERGWVLLGMAEERASLEDVFVRLTTDDLARGEGPRRRRRRAAGRAADLPPARRAIRCRSRPERPARGRPTDADPARRCRRERRVGHLQPRAARLLLLAARLRDPLLLPGPERRRVHLHRRLPVRSAGAAGPAVRHLLQQLHVLDHPPRHGADDHHAPARRGAQERLDRGADDGAGERGAGGRRQVPRRPRLLRLPVGADRPLRAARRPLERGRLGDPRRRLPRRAADRRACSSPPASSPRRWRKTRSSPAWWPSPSSC